MFLLLLLCLWLVSALLFYFLLTITLQHYYFGALFHYSLIPGEDDRLDTSVLLGCPSRSVLPVCPYICIKLLECSIREKTLLSYHVSDASCLFHSDNTTRDRTIAVIAVCWTRRSTIVFAE